MDVHAPLLPRNPEATSRPGEPTLGPSPLVVADELRHQLVQLERRRELDEVSRALYPQRRRELQERLAQAEAAGPGTLPPPDTLMHSRVGRTWQRALTALVHPAASWTPPRAWTVRQGEKFLADGIRAGWAQRTTYYADDAGAAQLDGMLLAPGKLADCANKPRMVVVVGFAMSYELIVRQAKRFADDFDAVVVLHNSRGVGRSLGTQITIDQAVSDCRAVVRAQLAQGHTQLGVYGISMGSATAMRAVQQLGCAGELREGDVGLAASVRGLSSIPSVVGAWYRVGDLGLPPYLRWLMVVPDALGSGLGCVAGAVAGTLLRSGNLPTMDVTQVLRSPLPADEVMVTTAEGDWLVRGEGQLSRAMGLPSSGPARLPSGEHATVVARHGAGHNDQNVRTPAHDEVLRRWSERAHRAYEARGAA